MKKMSTIIDYKRNTKTIMSNVLTRPVLITIIGHLFRN